MSDRVGIFTGWLPRLALCVAVSGCANEDDADVHPMATFEADVEAAVESAESPYNCATALRGFTDGASRDWIHERIANILDLDAAEITGEDRNCGGDRFAFDGTRAMFAGDETHKPSKVAHATRQSVGRSGSTDALVEVRASLSGHQRHSCCQRRQSVRFVVSKNGGRTKAVGFVTSFHRDDAREIK